MKTLAKKILVLVLALAPVAAHADEGGAGPGGGNAVGKQLFDFYDGDSLKKISVKSTTAYTQVLQPILQNIKFKLPKFGESLVEGFDKKRWVLDPKPLSTAKCMNETLSGVKRTVIACQNGIEVRISKQWFEDKNVSMKNKAGLLLHEALRTFPLKDYSIHAITVALFEAPRMTSTELAAMLEENQDSESTLGNYSITRTREDLCGEIQTVQSELRQACSAPGSHRAAITVVARRLGSEISRTLITELHNYRSSAGFAATDEGACAAGMKAIDNKDKKYCQ